MTRACESPRFWHVMNSVAHLELRPLQASAKLVAATTDVARLRGALDAAARREAALREQAAALAAELLRLDRAAAQATRELVSLGTPLGSDTPVSRSVTDVKLAAFAALRAVRARRQAFQAWQHAAFTRRCHLALLQRAADNNRVRRLRAAFQTWATVAWESRIAAVLLSRSVALCSIFAASYRVLHDDASVASAVLGYGAQLRRARLHSGRSVREARRTLPPLQGPQWLSTDVRVLRLELVSVQEKLAAARTALEERDAWLRELEPERRDALQSMHRLQADLEHTRAALQASEAALRAARAWQPGAQTVLEGTAGVADSATPIISNAEGGQPLWQFETQRLRTELTEHIALLATSEAARQAACQEIARLQTQAESSEAMLGDSCALMERMQAAEREQLLENARLKAEVGHLQQALAVATTSAQDAANGAARAAAERDMLRDSLAAERLSAETKVARMEAKQQQVAEAFAALHAELDGARARACHVLVEATEEHELLAANLHATLARAQDAESRLLTGLPGGSAILLPAVNNVPGLTAHSVDTTFFISARSPSDIVADPDFCDGRLAAPANHAPQKQPLCTLTVHATEFTDTVRKKTAARMLALQQCLNCVESPSSLADCVGGNEADSSADARAPDDALCRHEPLAAAMFSDSRVAAASTADDAAATQYRALEQRLAERTTELQEAKVIAEASVNALHVVASDCEAAVARGDAAQAELAACQAALSEACAARDAAAARHIAAATECEALQASLALHGTQLSEAHAELSQRSVALHTAACERDAATQRAAELESTLSACQAALAQAEDSTAALHSVQALTAAEAESAAAYAARLREELDQARAGASVAVHELEQQAAALALLRSEAAALSTRVDDARAACAEAQRANQAAAQEAAELRAALAAVSAERAAAEERAAVCEAQLNEARDSAARRASEAQAAALEHEVLSTRAAALEEQLARVQAAFDETQAARVANAAEHDAATARCAQLEQAHLAVAQSLAAVEARGDAAQAELAACQAALSEACVVCDTTSAHLVAAQTRVADLEKARDVQSAALEAAAARYLVLEQLLAAQTAELEEAKISAAASVNALQSVASDCEGAVAQAASMLNELAACKEALSEASAARDALTARFTVSATECEVLKSSLVSREQQLADALAELSERAAALQTAACERDAAIRRAAELERRLAAGQAVSESAMSAASTQYRALQKALARRTHEAEETQAQARVLHALAADDCSAVHAAQTDLNEANAVLAGLVSSAVLACRQQALSHLGGVGATKVAALWIRYSNGATTGSAHAWCKCAVCLTGAGMLELQAAETTNVPAQVVDVSACTGVVLAAVDSYRVSSLRRGKTVCFHLLGRNSSLALAATGSSDADTREWAALLRLFVTPPI